MEHLQHFGLTQDPFSNEPDLRFYFDSARHKEVTLRVDRALRQGKGLTLLTGDPGTGKTLLARRLFESLEEEIFEVSLLVMLPGATDGHTVLSRFARALGAEEPGEDRSAVLASIYEQLAIVREDGRHALLIIDDAHILGPQVMAEVGGLLAMEYEDRRLLSLLLVGSSEIDGCMAGDASLLQRVDVRVQLSALDLNDTAAYVAHRLTVVGGAVPLLPAPTIESIFKFSRGRPRLINTLSDNALFEAYLAGRTTVGANDVERAAGDLGIGADPGTTYSQLTPLGPGGDSHDPVARLVEARPISDGPSGVDLGALLDASTHTEELTSILQVDPGMAGGTVDLDAEVEAVLAEREPDSEIQALPIFTADNSNATPVAEATRIVLPESDGNADDGEIAELDDLFVELIDE